MSFCSADPFAQVCFLTQSMVTEKIPKTLCPTWDQTLIFGEIEIHGKPRNLERYPPDVYIELFDHDTFVSLLWVELFGVLVVHFFFFTVPSCAHT